MYLFLALKSLQYTKDLITNTLDNYNIKYLQTLWLEVHFLKKNGECDDTFNDYEFSFYSSQINLCSVSERK